MKKLLAIVLALAMVLPMTFAVSAVDFSGQWEECATDPVSKPDAFFGIDVSESNTTFKRGEEVTVVLTLKDVTLTGKVDILPVGGRLPYTFDNGMGLIGLTVAYDKNAVTPLFSATAVDTEAEEENDDAGDISSVVTKCPNGWEALGSVDTENGIVDIAVADGNEIPDLVPAKSGDISIALTFKVSANCSSEELVFTVADIEGVNIDGNSACTLDDITIIAKDVSPTVQSESTVALPEGAIQLTDAGYRHENGVNAIYYTKTETTIGEVTKKFVNSVKDANAFAVIMFGDDGVVNYCNTVTGRKADGATEIKGEKDHVVIPAGTTVILVNKYTTDSKESEVFNNFVETVRVGSVITVYNVNYDGFNYLCKTEALTNAGFVVSNVQPTEKEQLPEGAIQLTDAGYKHANGVNAIYYAETETTIGEMTKKFVNSVKDANAFAVIMFGDDGVVNYCNTVTGRKADGATEIKGEKDHVVIPAGTTVILVNKYTTDSKESEVFNNFVETVQIGSVITVYNVNVKEIKYLEAPYTLTDAGFTVTNPVTELIVKEGAPVIYDSENKKLYLYKDNVKEKGIVEFFENFNDVYDITLTDALLKTGSNVEDIKIIVMGDVNCNGKLDGTDYAMIKRHVLGTYVIKDDAFDAARLNGKANIVVNDYTICKRIALGTYKMINLIK